MLRFERCTDIDRGVGGYGDNERVSRMILVGKGKEEVGNGQGWRWLRAMRRGRSC